jgi:glycosyltransferase involved in cell wall biosynthesis
MTAATDSWPIDIHVLIPAYKSAHTLEAFLPKLLHKTPPENICLVDDASEDGTELLANGLGIQTIKHNVNKGKGACLRDGFDFLIKHRHARWILTMDADGQHSVDDAPKFLDYVNKFPDAGICIGMRNFSVSAMPPARIISNTLTSKIMSILTGQKIFDSQCGFRIYSAKLLACVSCKYDRFEMESEIIQKACFNHFSIGFIKVQTLYLNDSSHISHFKDTVRWLKAVFGVWKELRFKAPQ